ncbi:Cytosolic sulfotransferase 15 [Vitis vinifera]|uniref:Sulfotransferase n=1 Tax=Vitis vinifera TaxID=29760 RepID=A0A438IK16_VITVI|nr:Cytosolic sulfotransferase 15 [Vitis vinifera]
MGFFFYQYQGCWIQGIISFHRNFHAKATDLLLCTLPKSGTTWLKALAFSIANRYHYAPAQTPLHTSSPRALVPCCKFHLFENDQNSINLDGLPSPRIFATHAPYSLLPHSVKDSNCRIVYICRNPLDHFISHWHFVDSIGTQSPGDVKATSYEDALVMFCEGVNAFGPIWDHVLGYWKESKERPDKVLFLTYEDLKEDAIPHIKRRRRRRRKKNIVCTSLTFFLMDPSNYLSKFCKAIF